MGKTSVDFELSPYKQSDGKQAIKLRVRNAATDAKRSTGIAIEKKYWDAKKRVVKSTHVLHRQHNAALAAQKAKAEEEISEGVTDARQAAASVFKTHSMSDALQSDIAALEKTNGHGAAMLRSAANHLKAYAPTVQAEGMTSRFVQGFMSYLKNEGLNHNSVVSVLSRIRASFRRNFPTVADPFAGAKVGAFRPSGDVPLSEDEIKALWSVVLTSRIENIARDAFLFSFFAAGMRFGDVLRLKWTDVQAKQIVLEPRKTQRTTGVRVTIPITAPLKTILERQTRNGETVFGMLAEGADYKREQSAQSELSQALKRVALRAEVKANLKFKLARTTFAHLSRAATGDVYAVKQAMGHSRLATTEVYLASNTMDATTAAKSIAGIIGKKK